MMNILVPDHYSKEHIEKIKMVSKNIEVVRLGVQKQFQGFHALLYKFLPLTLHNKFTPFLTKPNPIYKITVDGKDLNEPLYNINILLSSWVINSDILTKVLPFLPNLRWIHSTVTGINHLLCHEILNDDNIQLTNSKGVHSVAVAEFVLALMLAFSKRIPEHIHLQQKKKWQVLKADELADKTVGIVGFGNIGREIAKKARIMGMKVVAIRRNSVESNNVDILLSAEGLQELLMVSDFVVISAPLTKETSGIIGEEELKTMKRSAYLINISRDEIVQKEALIRALKQKWIAGASIDAFHQPLPQNSPYYSLPNLIITHHSAYFTPAANKRIFDFFLANLKRFVTGDELLGKVDKKSGY